MGFKFIPKFNSGAVNLSKGLIMFAWHVTGGFCLNFPTSAAKEQPHSLHTKQTTSVLETCNKTRHMGTWLQHPKDRGNSVQKGVSLYSSRAVSS